MVDNMANNEALKRLRWSCRRGMLELDLILGQFLEQVYLSLSPDEQALFKELLTATDQDLYAWLLGSRQPTDSRFIPLLSKIYTHAQITTPPKTL